jgi:hypothetical protein
MDYFRSAILEGPPGTDLLTNEKQKPKKVTKLKIHISLFIPTYRKLNSYFFKSVYIRFIPCLSAFGVLYCNQLATIYGLTSLTFVIVLEEIRKTTF